MPRRMEAPRLGRDVQAWGQKQAGRILFAHALGRKAQNPYSTVPAANRFVAFLTSCDAAPCGEWGT